MRSVTLLQLDTNFPRIPGDVGSADTWSCPLNNVRIAAADVRSIVTDAPESINIAPFEDASRLAVGTVTITSCGFLSFWQSHLDALCPTPFISSSLVALPLLAKRFTPNELLILTFDDAKLGSAHLGAGFEEYSASIVGLRPDMHLRKVIKNDLPSLDPQLVKEQILDLLKPHVVTGKTKAIVLECTNLSPYKKAIRAAYDLEIHDILTVVEDHHAGLVKPEFAHSHKV
jgi:hypothetical protein